MAGTDSGEGPDGETSIEILRDVFLTGLAVVVPLMVTLYLIWLIVGWFGRALRPFISLLEISGLINFIQQRGLIVLLLEAGIYGDVIGLVSELVAVVLFTLAVIAIGFLAQYRYGEWLVGSFDYAISSIPGIGTLYQSFRQVGLLLMDTSADDFKGVKLVELLHDETYVLAFETNESEEVAAATGHDQVQTLFIPMAPNPVTGGFLAYVPEERVMDVDITVEEGIRAILTSGIAADESERPNAVNLEDITPIGDRDPDPDPGTTGGN